jgi:hypothetical protein
VTCVSEYIPSLNFGDQFELITSNSENIAGQENMLLIKRLFWL